MADWLLEQCGEDAALHAELKARAVRGGRSPDIKRLKEVVRSSLAVRGFVDYRRMREVARRAESVIQLIEELLRDGRAAMAAELADYAVQRGITAYANMDDSGGVFGECLGQLSELHLRAYRKAGAGYRLTGKILFNIKYADDWGFFRLKDYAPLLDDEELAHYRKLAEQEWAKVPAVTPAKAKRHTFSGSEHYRITALMEELAQYEDNLERLIAIKSRDLGMPYHFLAIAELLKQAGRADEALAWAERGLKHFPDTQDLRLIGFLVKEYQRRKRNSDAVEVVWNHFRQHPQLEAYKLLLTAAKKAGDGPAQRERVLAHIRAARDKQARGKTAHWIGRPLLIDIYLWEKDIASALREARAGGATEDQWFQLAKACEQDWPTDAAEIYRKRLNDVVRRKNNEAYDRGAEIVKTVRTLMQRAKQNVEFQDWLAKVRSEHKAKRNFMQRLDGIFAATGKQHQTRQK